MTSTPVKFHLNVYTLEDAKVILGSDWVFTCSASVTTSLRVRSPQLSLLTIIAVLTTVGSLYLHCIKKEEKERKDDRLADKMGEKQVQTTNK